jgi:chloramphenicol-sensitive protein RarD
MNAPDHPETAQARANDDHPRGGFLLGLGAYGLWGFLPIYFKALAGVPTIDIVAHHVRC